MFKLSEKRTKQSNGGDNCRFSDSLAAFAGSWKQVEVNNMSNFLEAQGISWMQRKLAASCNPTDTITIDGDKVNISFNAAGVISGSNDYIIGGATKIKNYLKEEVTAEAAVESGNFVITITGGKAGTVRMTRSIKDGKLHVEQVMVEKNVTASRIFERQS